MITFEALEENLRFLVLEVESQVTLTFRLLNDADLDLLEKISAKGDYIEDLIDHCAEIEQAHPAPFSIQIHGDFNANTIIFNADNGHTNYIDFYRSQEADYIQDASVFLVSNFRMPVFDPSLRQRLNRVIRWFFEFSAGFARDQGDACFELRMALALARSFYTSTRFELNQDFVHDMFSRAHYLMEKVLDHPGPGATFRLEREVLFY